MSKLVELFKKENIVKGLKWFFFSYIWLFVLLFVIDIVTKHVALNAFGGWELFYAEETGGTVQFIPGFMSFTITFNTGMAWGLLQDVEDIVRRIILIGVSLVMTVGFIVFYAVKFKKINNWYKAFLMCLAAGALGNLIDRAFYPDGKVIDFLKFDFMPQFPVFNFADAVLVVSVIGMMIYMIVEEILAFVKKKKLANQPQLNVKENSDSLNEEKNVSTEKNEDTNDKKDE